MQIGETGHDMAMIPKKMSSSSCKLNISLSLAKSAKFNRDLARFRDLDSSKPGFCQAALPWDMMLWNDACSTSRGELQIGRIRIGAFLLLVSSVGFAKTESQGSDGGIISCSSICLALLVGYFTSVDNAA
jgi:hypothetical protein